MLPGYARDDQSGGLRSAPTLAESSFGHELYRAQWHRTIAGYVVEAALPIMMFLLAGIALVAAPSTARPGFARWLAVALVATAFLRLGNAIASWTDLLGVITLGRLNAFLWSPLAMLSWTAAWNEWADGRERRLVLLAAFGAWAMRIVAVAAHVHMLDSIGRYVSIVLFVLIAARIIVRGERKLLALGTISVVAIALFINEISRLGVPDIWFPFNIGVTLTQYAYALSLPLLAFALIATNGSAKSSR